MQNTVNISRVGKKWTKEEDTELMKRVNDGMGLVDIAIAHQRNVTGVKLRIMGKAISMVEKQSISINEASKLVNITVEDLIEYKLREEDKRNQTKNKKHKEKYWSSFQEEYLLDKIRADLEIDEIAKKMNKTARLNTKKTVVC